MCSCVVLSCTYARFGARVSVSASPPNCSPGISFVRVLLVSFYVLLISPFSLIPADIKSKYFLVGGREK